jgi:uncharacterized protein YjiS (DUF1127 family)
LFASGHLGNEGKIIMATLAQTAFAPAAFTTVVAHLNTVIANFFANYAEYRTIKALNLLGDRELFDIGLSRDGIAAAARRGA